jgi:hypothetical protein
VAVTEGVDRLGHGRVRICVVKELGGCLVNGVGVGTDKAGDACLYRFRPFGGFPQHEDGLAEARGFLLYAAGVGEDKIGVGKAGSEIEVTEGFGESHVLRTAQYRSNGVADGGTLVEGKQNLDIAAGGESINRGHQATHYLSLVLPPVQGH